MANQQHLDMLKQGQGIWNKWRNEHPDIRPDLRGADLYRVDLSGANLSSADLSGAHLSGASFFATNLSGADLSGANLFTTNFNGTNLRNTDLSHAYIGWVTFGDVDLRSVKGLDTIHHGEPSTIGIDTIIHSQGKISEIFLRNAGVPGAIIEAIPSLIGSLSPIDFYSCFISYSNRDQSFAERLYADLQSKGVRCWFAPKDMKIGDKIRPRIDEAIRLHDKLLLVLSEHSVQSEWVEKEVETAFEKERLQNRLVLFPIRLDDCVMQTTQAWAADIRRTRHIGDFRNWKQQDDYQKALSRLLRDLKAGE